MSDVVVVETNDDASDVEDAVEGVEDAVEDMADAVQDAVMDATTISLVERITRAEDALQVLSATVETMGEQLAECRGGIENLNERINFMSQQQQENQEETAEAVEGVVEEIVEAAPSIKEDEVPTVKEHPFFRKWGRRK